MTEEEQEEIVHNLLKELEKVNAGRGTMQTTTVREHEIFHRLPDGVSVEQAKAALKRLAGAGKIHCQNGSCSTIKPPPDSSILRKG